MTEKVGVGVGVILLRDNKILLGLRNPDPKKADSRLHGEGTWSMPGGKVEFGETLKETCFREVLEETGIKINTDSLRRICVLENILRDAHFITFGFICEDFEGEAEPKEPEEIIEWKWFDLDNLPSPIYKASDGILEAFLKNENRGLFSQLNQLSWKQFYRANQKCVFTSIPSKLFYLRGTISKFVLEKGFVPFNPYMNFDYNILNSTSKEKIREANNNLIRNSDELWVFLDGIESLTDGVIFEINLARDLHKKIRFFTMPNFKEIKADIRIEMNDYYGNKLKENKDLTYVAFSSKKFYLRTSISKFVLLKDHTPLNPFMSFDYFLADLVGKDKILFANSTFIEKAKELWVFGPISDGVMAEIKLAEKLNKPIKFFSIDKDAGIKEIEKSQVQLEAE